MAVVTKQQQFEYIVNAEHSPVDGKKNKKKKTNNNNNHNQLSSVFNV